MNPNYNTWITVYNAVHVKGQKDSWVSTQLPNCFFKAEVKTAYSATTANRVNVYTARIPDDGGYVPQDEWTGDGYTIQTGDVIVKGRCDEEITEGAAKFLQKHKPDAFMVTAFSDNCAWIGAHLKVTG